MGRERGAHGERGSGWATRRPRPPKRGPWCQRRPASGQRLSADLPPRLRRILLRLEGATPARQHGRARLLTFTR